MDGSKVKQATLEYGAISARKCARRILAGVAKNRGIILVKPLDYPFRILHRVSPGLLSPVNRMIAKYFRENFKKQ